MNVRRDDIANVSAIVSGGLVAWLIHPLIGVGVGATTYILTKHPQAVSRWSRELVRVPGADTLIALSAAWDKMRQDFRYSSLRSFEILDSNDEATVHELTQLLGNDVRDRLPDSAQREFTEESWHGKVLEKAARDLRDEIQKIGRPLRICCSSISVVCVAVLKGLHQHGIDVELTIDAPSGLEQAKRISADSFDLMVLADAPFFLLEKDELRAYRRMHEVFRERQGILKRSGTSHGTPTIWTYPDSSAKLQLKIARQRSLQRRFSLPAVLQERPVSLKGIATCSDFMSTGDYIFAWEPLLSSLRSDTRLEYVDGSSYDLTISLFAHKNLVAYPKLVSAFSDVFIGEWNYCGMNRLFAWARLLGDGGFRDSFVIGSGVGWKVRRSTRGADNAG